MCVIIIVSSFKFLVLSPLRYALGSAAFVMKWRKKAPLRVERQV